MSNGWTHSAPAWIAAMGETGDWGREHVLDPVMIERATARDVSLALDVGCGEGRFSRMLQARGIKTIGLDPTPPLLDEACRRDPAGDYQLGQAESLEFEAESFDLVVAYLTLLDIDDFRGAIKEMTRVLRPQGSLLVANLNSFFTSSGGKSWVLDDRGKPLHYPLDRYQEEFPTWVEWDGIRVENWHRPLGAYMQAFLDCGLTLSYFAEPNPVSGEAARQARYRRAPWFLVMEWRKAVA